MRPPRDRFERRYPDSTQLLVERSTAGPIGSTHLATVISPDGETAALRWFFFDEYSERSALTYGRLMATDEDYRRAYDNREIEWAIVADIYGDFARRILGVFADAGVLGEGALDPHMCPVTEAQYQICEPIYVKIMSLVESGSPFSEWDYNDLYYDPIEQARSAAQELSIGR